MIHSAALNSQPQSIIRVWPLLISHLAEGNRLSWRWWLVTYQRQSVSVIVTGNLQHPLIQLIILLTRRLAIAEKAPCVRTQVRMGSRSETRSDPCLDPTQTRILIRTRSTRTLIRTRIRFLTRIRTRSATDLRSGLQSELVDPIWHFPPISCCLAIKYRRTR